MSTFHCKPCGQPILRSEHVLDKQIIWDLHDYRAECYLIAEAIDQDSLRRYDCSWHEGWYCCRFIMMRMTVDKFGTGRLPEGGSNSVVECQLPKLKRAQELKAGTGKRLICGLLRQADFT